MDEQRPWHRLFAAAWTDFFRGSDAVVEPERDLSVKKQMLDVLIIRLGAGPLPWRPPDGFEDMAPYNLVTFRSHRDKLSTFALQELVGHYVNLRKQVSPTMDEPDLLPADDFRLFAVAARFPRNLAEAGIELRKVKAGVNDVVLAMRVRVVVCNELPLEGHNAQLLVAAASDMAVAYGSQHFQIRSRESSTILTQYFERYRREAIAMPDLLEELHRETIEMIMNDPFYQNLLKAIPVEKRLEGVPVEKRLEGVPVDEVLAALPPQVWEAIRRQQKDGDPSPPSGGP